MIQVKKIDKHRVQYWDISTRVSQILVTAVYFPKRKRWKYRVDLERLVKYSNPKALMDMLWEQSGEERKTNE